VSLLYPVVNEVEQRFSGRGMTGGNCVSSVFLLSLNTNTLGKAAALHLTLALFCGWGCTELSLQNIEYNCAYVLIGFSYSTPHNLFLRTPNLQIRKGDNQTQTGYDPPRARQETDHNQADPTVKGLGVKPPVSDRVCPPKLACENTKWKVCISILVMRKQLED
jgi:hypothetical protein